MSNERKVIITLTTDASFSDIAAAVGMLEPSDISIAVEQSTKTGGPDRFLNKAMPRKSYQHLLTPPPKKHPRKKSKKVSVNDGYAFHYPPRGVSPAWDRRVVRVLNGQNQIIDPDASLKALGNGLSREKLMTLKTPVGTLEHSIKAAITHQKHYSKWHASTPLSQYQQAQDQKTQVQR